MSVYLQKSLFLRGFFSFVKGGKTMRFILLEYFGVILKRLY